MNLDDLLKSIRDEGKKESALVKYEGKRDEDLVDEEIDERILNFLGLEDIFDIDYGTYQTLLKEKLAAARMGAKKIPAEEDELLVKEFRRVKSKTGRFKLKKKKITADSISGLTVTKKAPLLLTGKVSVVDKPIDAKGDLSITPILNSILLSLKSISNTQQKASEKSRKESENRRRKKKEEDLEKGKKAFQNIVQTVISPLQNILDRIWKFIFFTILGRAFGQLMDWLKNPENQRKLSNLVRFVKDWWPSLLAAYLLFLTPFGKFVKSTLTLVKLFGKQLLKLLPVLKNPFVAVPAAFTGMALLANEVTGQRQAAPVQAENKARAQTGKGLGVQGTDTAIDRSPSVGDLGPTTPYGMLQGIRRGGLIQRAKSGAMIEGGYGGIDSDTGVSITGAGPDTQLIAARPGEVVLTPEDQGAIYQKTGFDVANYVKDRKPQFIPTNKVRTSDGLRLANLGGLVGFNQGGIVGMQGGGLFSPVMRIMHGTKAGAPESIRSSGFRQQHGMLGKGVYGSVKGWVADTYRGAGALRGIFPGQGPRLNMIVPQSSRTLRGATVVSPRIANKGLSMADRLLQGQYPKSAKAAELRRMLSAPTPTMGRAFLGGLGSRLSRTPLIGDMLFPQGTTAYDQLTGPNAYYNAPGYKGPKPSAKQGGGLIEGNNLKDIKKRVDATINANLPQTIADYQAQVESGFRPPFDPETFQQELEKQRRNARRKMIHNYLLQQPIQQKRGGGLIKENTGMDIPGATADRQAIAAQPGEYMIPAGTVSRVGKNFLDQLVANSDPDSTPAKLGMRNKKIANITPYNTGRMSPITLPPINQSSGGNMKMPGGSTKVPMVSAVSPAAASERQRIAQQLGIG